MTDFKFPDRFYFSLPLFSISSSCISDSDKSQSDRGDVGGWGVGGVWENRDEHPPKNRGGKKGKKKAKNEDI